MTNNVEASGAQTPSEEDASKPLEAEPGIPSITTARSTSLSWKGIFALALMVFSLVAVTAAVFNRAVSSYKKGEDDRKAVGERPSAATTEPRKLDLTLPAASQPGKLIPAIVPTPADAEREPIGVRRTGSEDAHRAGPERTLPEDAPALLISSRPGASTPPKAAGTATHSPPPEFRDGFASPDPLQDTRRSLEAYQRQLQALLDTLNRSAPGRDTNPIPAPLSPSTSSSTRDAAGLFGGQLQGSATPPVAATRLSNRSLMLPKGTSFTCALKTRIISAASGMVGCIVQRNVYGDDGRVLLIERGSQVDGEYRITSVRAGTVRIPVLWTRARTPHGVLVEFDSPATGSLGEAGVEGFVDNRWGERIGAALLLSMIDDAVKLTIQDHGTESQGNTVVLPTTTSSTTKLAEKVLDSTINIPPLIYQNQGGVVGVYVARDVDFSGVYELKAVPR